MMRRITVLGLGVAFLALTSAAFAEIRQVPGQYFLIQDAIDASNTGDVVLVSAGMYPENISFNGTNIIVTSTNPDDPMIVEATIIQGIGTGSVVTFSGSEDANCTLDGITITGGNTSGDGGGVCGNGTGATINNCIIRDNHAEGNGGGLSDCNSIIRCTISNNSATNSGGGLCCYISDVLVSHCLITGNTANGSGGGIYLAGDLSPELKNCLIADNTAGEDGGGLSCNWLVEPTISNCTIADNNVTDGYGGGLYCSYESYIEVIDSIIWGNISAYDGSQIAISNGDLPFPLPSTVTITYSDIQLTPDPNFNVSPIYIEESCTLTGWDPNDPNDFWSWDVNSWNPDTYNIDPDPLFVAGYYLSHVATGQDVNSPCINAGSDDSNDPNITMHVYTTRIDGVPDDCTYGDPNDDPNNAIVDMGYHYSEGLVQYLLTLTVINDNGTFTVDPDRLVDYDPNTNTYTYINFDGFVSTLIAIPNPNYRVKGWYDVNGILVSINTVFEVVMDSDKSFTLEFEIAPWVLYVDADANGANDGLSWADAYNYLQDALMDANSDPYIRQIRVAQGVYKPDQSSADPNGSRDPNATFQLISGVAIYGGYAGFGQPDPNARDIQSYETVLSGDLDGNDVPGLDPCDLLNDPNRGENSYHVVTGSGTDANTILDGFTITAGNAGSPPHNRGGGIYNDNGSPTITNCTFSDNSAVAGSGMSNDDNSSPILTNCTFSGNSATSRGGGMCNDEESSPILTNCTFSDNLAGSKGGGMCNYDHSSPTLTNCAFSCNSSNFIGGGMYNSLDCNPTVTNCTFTGNSAEHGGGMCNRNDSCPIVTNGTFTGNFARREGGGMLNGPSSSPTVTGCTFTGNSASSEGGGMDNYDNSSPTVSNCTFSGNSADWNGGGMCNYFSSSPTVTGCILWGNIASSGSNEIYNNSTSSTPVISYCDIAGCLFGGSWDTSLGSDEGGNIDDDPLFVDPGRWVDVNDPNIIVEPNDPNAVWVDGDYHLRSQGWQWDSVRQRWDYDEEVTSRCIDAGNPGCQLSAELLSVPEDPTNIWGENIRINMGAYGGTAEASMPPYDWALLADLTNDGTVNLEDFAGQANDWLESESEQPGDLDRNGLIDFADILLLTEDWLKQTTWH